MTKSASEIAAYAESRAETMTGQIRVMNRIFRQQDESHKWPVRNRFDATERAIRKARRFFAETGGPSIALEYALTVDGLLSDIVNRSI